MKYRIWFWSISWRGWVEYSEGWLTAKQFDIDVMRRRDAKTCFAVEKWAQKP